MGKTSEALRAYADQHYEHVVGYLGDCAPRLGDRCDVTAAYYHAAKMVDEFEAAERVSDP